MLTGSGVDGVVRSHWKLEYKKTLYLKCIIKYLLDYNKIFKYEHQHRGGESERAPAIQATVSFSDHFFLYFLVVVAFFSCMIRVSRAKSLMTSLKDLWWSWRSEERAAQNSFMKVDSLSDPPTPLSACVKFSHRFFTCGGASCSPIGRSRRFSAFHQHQRAVHS